MTKKAVRVMSFLLAASILLSSAAPGSVLVEANANAETNSSQTEPSVTEALTGASEDTPVSQSLDVTVPVQKKNCNLFYLDGTEITDSITGAAGDVIQFQIQLLDGCQITSVLYGGSTVVPADGVYKITLKENAELNVSCDDISVPVISTPTRTETGWVKEAHYTFTVTDNLTLNKVQFSDANGKTQTLTADANGVYTATASASGTYTILAVDSSGLRTTATVEETYVDSTAPTIVKMTRQEDGWKTSVNYTLQLRDEQSGIYKVTLQKDGGEEVTQASLEGNTCQLRIDASTSYTIRVYDNVGNVLTQTLTDSQIDTQAPAIESVSRNQSGWQKATATYTFKVTDTGSGISQVTFGKEGGTMAKVTASSDGSYTVTVDANGQYKITAVDLTGWETSYTFTEDHLDLVAPEVSEPVRETQQWTNAAVYRFTATDTGSGITSVVITNDTTGSTISAVAEADGSYCFTLTQNGKYTLTVTDGVGRTVTKTISETMCDVAAPTISSFTRIPESWSTSAVYRFVAGDAASGIAEVSIKVNGGAEQKLTLVEKSEDDPFDPQPTDANVTFTPYYTFRLEENAEIEITVKDVAGNTLTQQKQELYIDRTAPSISTPQRLSNGQVQLSTYTFTVTDSGCGIASVTMTNPAGESTTISPDESGACKALIQQNGEYTITAQDKLGNSASIKFTESDVDSVAPEIQNLSRSAAGWQKSVSYTFQVKEEGSGLNAVYLTVNGERTDLTATDGTYRFTLTANCAFTITAEDVVGNKTEISQNEAKVDPDAPVISTVTRAETGWAKTATYSFYVNDPLSGVSEVTLALSDGTSATLTPTDGMYSFRLEKDLDFTITAKDLVGNTSSVQGKEERIDRESPKITELKREDDQWHKESTYTFRVSDDKSGVGSVTVSVGDGAAVTLTPVDGLYTFTATINGTVRISAADAVGNTATANSIETKIDTTAPQVLDLARKETGWATTATYTFTVEEAGSGLNQVTVAIGQEEAMVLTPDSQGIYSFTVAENAVFSVKASDMVANETVCSGVESQIDTTAPEIKNLIRVDASWTSEAVYEFLVDDPASGIQSVLVKVNGGQPQYLSAQDGRYTFSMVENGTFTITVTDNLGNSVTVNGEEALVDTAAPAIMDFKRTEFGWSTTAEYTFQVYDATSEVQSVAVRYANGEESELTIREDGRYAFVMTQNGTATVVVTDLAGNETTQAANESLVDPDGPSITEPQRHSESWDVRASYTFSVADALSGVASVSAVDEDGNETELTPSNGVYTINLTKNGVTKIVALDHAGNSSVREVSEQKIDTTAPAIQELNRNAEGWRTLVTYTFQVYETQCGTKEVTLTLGTGTPQKLTPTDGVYSFTLDANTSFSIRAVDYVGNESVVSADETQVDNTAPVLSTPVRVETGWSSTGTYNFTCTDGLSGVQSVTLTLADGTTKELTGVDGKYYFVLDCNTAYEITAVDLVGNTISVTGEETFIDKTDPVITDLTRQEEGYVTSATYSFTIDEMESGIQSVTLTVGVSDSVVLAPVNGVYYFTMTTNDHFLITVTDGLGHRATASGDETQIDLTGPTISQIQRADTKWYTEVNYTFTVKDTLAGVQSVKVYSEDQQEIPVTELGNDSYRFTASDNMTYTITATDKLGNVSSETVTESKMDLTAPVISIYNTVTEVCSDGNHGWYRSIRYYLDIQESESGIQSVTVTFDSTGSKTNLYKDSTNRYYFDLKQNDTFLVQVTDQMGNVGTLSGEVQTIDRTAPAIQDLTRDTDQWSNLATYRFKAVDNDAGICSVKLTVGSRDAVLLTPGEDGTCSFTVSENTSFVIALEDRAGNTFSYSGKESKIDTAAPQITNLRRSESSWAKTATYYFYVSDSHSGVAEVTVTIGGGEPVVLTPSGSRYSFTISTNESFVITATDGIGNQSTVTGEETQTDNTAPVIGNLTRASEGWLTSAAYTFTVDETQSGIRYVYVYVNGVRRSVTEENGTYSFTATATGTIRIEATDQVGNTSELTVEEVMVDTVNPVLSVLTRTESGWVKTAEYTFTASDADSGVASVVLTYAGLSKELSPKEDGSYSFTADANITYTVTVTDGVGHTYTRSVTESRIDAVAPEIQSFARTKTGWQASASYSFRVADREAGIQSVVVKLGDAEAQTLEMVSGRYTFTMEENASYEVLVTDNVGNVTILTGEETEIDNTAPEIGGVARVSDTWQAAAKYRFTVVEEQSGAASAYVTAEDGTMIAVIGPEDDVYSFTVTATGKYTITITDNVGNTSSKLIAEYMVDTAPPEIYDIVRTPDDWSQEGSYTFKVRDALAGMKSVSVALDETIIEVTENSDGSYSFPVAANGDYTIIAIDQCGNTVCVVVGEERIDLTPPVITGIHPQTEWDQQSNEVKLVVTDESAMGHVVVTDEDGMEYTAAVGDDGIYRVTVDANGTYQVTAWDKAGNFVTSSFVVDHIDTEVPSAPAVTTSADTWTNENVSLIATAQDSQSGVAAYYFSTTGKDFAKYPEEWRKMSFDGGEGRIILTENQDAAYYIIAVDAVGRYSDSTVVTVKIDKTAPESVNGIYLETEEAGFVKYLGNTAIYKDMFAFTLTASDSASGVSQIAYRLVSEEGYEGEWIIQDAPNCTLDMVIQDVPEGHYTIQIKAKDIAGNWTEEFQPVMDDTPVNHILEYTPANSESIPPEPVLTVLAGVVTYNGKWTNQDVTIRVSGSSAISGIDHYEYMITYADPLLADTAWTTVDVDSNGVAQIVIDQDTNAVYHFRAITNAGNYSMVADQQVLVQKTLPYAAQVSVSTPTGNNNWYTKAPVITVVAPTLGEYAVPVFYEFAMYRDGNLVSIETTYTLDEIPEIPEDGIWKIVVTAKDEAGNVAPSDAGTVSVKLDSTPPTSLSVMLNTMDITNIQESITASWRDGVATINHVQFSSDYTVFENRTSTVKAYANGGLSGKATLYYQIVPTNTSYKQRGDWAEYPAGGIQIEPEGKYCLFFKAVDGAGNVAYFSGSSVILDSIAPAGRSSAEEITITLRSTNLSRYGCYSGDVTADISIMEPDLNSDDAFSGLAYATYRIITDGQETASGVLFSGDLEDEGIVKMEGSRVEHWAGKITIDAKSNNSNNVIIEITAHDQAGNVRITQTEPGDIRIDLDKPIVEASYDNNSPVTKFEGTEAFTGKRTLVVTVTERNFEELDAVIRIVDTDSSIKATYEWQHQDDIHTAIIPIEADGHYEVTMEFTDSAGNTTTEVIWSEDTVAPYKFIIDNTAPTITASFDNNNVRNEMYFHSARTITIRVVERNFDPAMISAQLRVVLEGGATSTLYLSNWVSNGSIHSLTYKCLEDGTYSFKLSGSDALGNVPGEIRIDGDATSKFVVDTHIDDPIFENVVDGGAYAGTIAPLVTALDENLDSVLISMTRANRNESREDVSTSMLSELVLEDVEGGKSALLDVFEKIPEYDGIYTLTVFASDLAGNIVQQTIRFSVNRFGSVYVYDRDTSSLIGDSRQLITDDLVISEYNPSSIIAGSARVFITRDGMPVSDPIYEVTSVTSEEEEGVTKWCQYDYIISKDNFQEDGIYEVVISTKDTAGNYPENTDEEDVIRFSVDTTPPQLSSIIGLEDAIHKGTYLNVELTATDNVSVESILVYVDNVLHTEWTELSGYTVERDFGLTEGMNQEIRIIVKDAAGNKLDTKDESFQPGYEFNRTVTVSANFFLRFYANKTLFYSFMISVIVLGIIWIIILIRQEQKESAEEDAELAADAAARKLREEQAVREGKYVPEDSDDPAGKDDAEEPPDTDVTE